MAILTATHKYRRDDLDLQLAVEKFLSDLALSCNVGGEVQDLFSNSSIVLRRTRNLNLLTNKKLLISFDLKTNNKIDARFDPINLDLWFAIKPDLYVSRDKNNEVLKKVKKWVDSTIRSNQNRGHTVTILTSTQYIINLRTNELNENILIDDYIDSSKSTETMYPTLFLSYTLNLTKKF